MDEEDFKKWCCEKRRRMVNFQSLRCAKLNGYKLAFNYCSKTRGGGAANIMEDSKSCVYGLLSEIEDTDLEVIRKKEGYSKDCSRCSYNEICVDVEVNGSIVSNVKTYKVSESKERTEHQPPTKAYLSLLIRNARKYNFPTKYIEFLESTTYTE